MGGALLVVALPLLVVWWTGGEGDGRGVRPRPVDSAITREVRAAGPLIPVRGNPGYGALGDPDRERASRPISPEAVEWLEENRPVIRQVARAVDVSPVALGGIVAAEKTLLVGRMDVIGEALFRTVFGSLREADLDRWIDRRETRYREQAGNRSDSRFSVKNPYEWTLGPAQVSFRLAVQYEPWLAQRLGRPERSAREIVNAVTTTPGNLEYAAALLAEAERAYRILAGMDIARNPGVLATLYHVGAPTVRARRLAAENAERRARGEPVQIPHVNYYGAFVNLHAEEIGNILSVE